MNENTANKVKVWNRDSIHPTHAGATQRKTDCEGTCDEVKIHKQARGFVVKVWHGVMQDAPPPKPKKEPAPFKSGDPLL